MSFWVLSVDSECAATRQFVAIRCVHSVPGCCLTPVNAHVYLRFHVFGSVQSLSPRRKGKRVSSVMEGGQEVLKRESMGRRFKGELRDLVERIHSTEVRHDTPAPVSVYISP